MKQYDLLCASEEGFHRVAYTEWGTVNPDYPPVICVHGLTRNGRDFDSLARFLSEQGRHVFCPDIVGRGESDWFDDGHHYNFPQYVNDMTSLIARIGADQVDWIGTSMGGLIGMMIAAMKNNPIHRMVMNDVGAQIPVQALWRLSKYVGKDPEFINKEEAKRYFKTIYAEFGHLTEEQWDEFTEHSIWQEESGRYTTKLDPKVKEGKSKTQLLKEFFFHPHKALEGIVFDIELWSTWEQVKCPTLIIHGHHSELLLNDAIRKMQTMHPQTELLEIQDAGHAPALLEQAQHQHIADWLAAGNNIKPCSLDAAKRNQGS